MTPSLPDYLAWLDLKVREECDRAERMGKQGKFYAAAAATSMSVTFAYAADELRRRMAEEPPTPPAL